jgi:hypothetical protein
MKNPTAPDNMKLDHCRECGFRGLVTRQRRPLCIVCYQARPGGKQRRLDAMERAVDRAERLGGKNQIGPYGAGFYPEG